MMPQEDTTMVSHEASSNEQLGDPAPDGHDLSPVTSDPSEGQTWGYSMTEVEGMRNAVESPELGAFGRVSLKKAEDTSPPEDFTSAIRKHFDLQKRNIFCPECDEPYTSGIGYTKYFRNHHGEKIPWPVEDEDEQTKTVEKQQTDRQTESIARDTLWYCIKEVITVTSKALRTMGGSCSVEWNSIGLTQIGTSDLQNAGTEDYDLPESIPSTAKEVLVYAVVQSGHSNPSQTSHLKLYTEEGGKRYEQYIIRRTYQQPAWNTNSDNMWFPMTASRQLHMEIPSSCTGNVSATVFVIGYR